MTSLITASLSSRVELDNAKYILSNHQAGKRRTVQVSSTSRFIDSPKTRAARHIKGNENTNYFGTPDAIRQNGLYHIPVKIVCGGLEVTIQITISATSWAEAQWKARLFKRDVKGELAKLPPGAVTKATIEAIIRKLARRYGITDWEVKC